MIASKTKFFMLLHQVRIDLLNVVLGGELICPMIG